MSQKLWDQGAGGTTDVLEIEVFENIARKSPVQEEALLRPLGGIFEATLARRKRSFTGERIIGAILFESTMDREIEGRPTSDYLWNVKRVVPFLKVDNGLLEETKGVQLMKPMPQLPPLLNKAKSKHIFGTKMRSLIKQANRDGIQEIVNQQFDVAAEIFGVALVPIIEPEVDIHCPDKARAEALLKDALLAKLDALPEGRRFFLKLTLPEQNDFYLELVQHRAVVRVLALSGGYSPRRCTPAQKPRYHRQLLARTT